MINYFTTLAQNFINNYDTNKNGVIDRNEIQSYLQVQGLPVDSEYIDRVFNILTRIIQATFQ